MKSITEYINEKYWDKYQNNKYEGDEIKSAIYDYVAGYTSGVNDDLRALKQRGSKNVIKNLDAAFESDYASKGKIDVWRTVKWEYMENVYHITPESIKDFVGTTLENKGFMSTTHVFQSPWGKTWWDDDVIMHITSTQQLPYLDINKIFKADEIDCEFQKEWLLPRNTIMTLDSFTIKTKKDNKMFDKNGNYVLELKIK